MTPNTLQTSLKCTLMSKTLIPGPLNIDSPPLVHHPKPTHCEMDIYELPEAPGSSWPVFWFTRSYSWLRTYGWTCDGKREGEKIPQECGRAAALRGAHRRSHGSAQARPQSPARTAL